QALRMYVNDEVGCLQEGLKGAVEVLSTGGRMGVITFHSIEDRLVKRMFRKFVDEGVLELLNRRVIKPSDEELQENRRARSAKLRGVRKVGDSNEHQY
ncbi:MAG: 16S rRNA (cytosine(1402)-N(4))-methyltransferase, partial [Synergistetes bacterium]|nr:16S rRNA (cytosine(1402)-N(4))-methyltransferase [Synergistota bacterium]